MLAYFDVSLGWREIGRRTLRETQADNGLGLAAQLAYYFFLALFPALLFVFALASFFPLDNMIGTAVDRLRSVAPPDVLQIIREQLQSLSNAGNGGILSFGVIAALWSSSAAMVAVVDALNRAYDVEDSRPWWKQRLTAILLTLGVAVFAVVSFALVIAGPEMADLVGRSVGLGPALVWTWKVLQWPIVFALIAIAIGLIYYFAPDVDQDWVWLTPGSLVAALLWIVGSVAFRFYVMNFGSYNETYGTIGGVMVLLLWLYLSGLVIIIGAEMNAEIEHAAPHAKKPGERKPGERVTIGARAAREYRERQERGEEVGRPAAPIPVPSRRPAAAVGRAAALVAGVAAMVFGRRVRH
jgi:membrane protein